MGHCISGIIAPLSLLREFSLKKALHPPTHVYEELGFLPLSDSHLDALFPEQGEFDGEMLYLSAALLETLLELSHKAPLAYIETDYFGGTGSQGATAYAEGRCLMKPESTEVRSLGESRNGPISEALRRVGVVRGPGDYDEFDTVGLGRFRHNEDWIESAC
jgi:hypothetical protein